MRHQPNDLVPKSSSAAYMPSTITAQRELVLSFFLRPRWA
jgi:hypothetical protein